MDVRYSYLIDQIIADEAKLKHPFEKEIRRALRLGINFITLSYTTNEEKNLNKYFKRIETTPSDGMYIFKCFFK